MPNRFFWKSWLNLNVRFIFWKSATDKLPKGQTMLQLNQKNLPQEWTEWEGRNLYDECTGHADADAHADIGKTIYLPPTLRRGETWSKSVKKRGRRSIECGQTDGQHDRQTDDGQLTMAIAHRPGRPDELKIKILKLMIIGREQIQKNFNRCCY